jgi:hypothetical protein
MLTKISSRHSIGRFNPKDSLRDMPPRVVPNLCKCMNGFRAIGRSLWTAAAPVQRRAQGASSVPRPDPRHDCVGDGLKRRVLGNPARLSPLGEVIGRVGGEGTRPGSASSNRANCGSPATAVGADWCRRSISFDSSSADDLAPFLRLAVPQHRQVLWRARSLLGAEFGQVCFDLG